MGRTYDEIDDALAAFLRRQHVFFVATAPLSMEGHINLSPKGLDSFRILDPRTVAYVDLIGSGIESVAHLKENARIVLMFCAFEGAPKIVRLHGRGEVIERSHAQFGLLRSAFPEFRAVRAIIRLPCSRIAETCGFGVPRYEFQGERTQLLDWASKRSDQGLCEYMRNHNANSIDGLCGLKPERGFV